MKHPLLPFGTLSGGPQGEAKWRAPLSQPTTPARGQSAQLGASGTPGASPSAAAAAEGETEAAPQPEGGGLPSAPPWDCTSQLARPLWAAKPRDVVLFCLGLGEEEDVAGSCQG